MISIHVYDIGMRLFKAPTQVEDATPKTPKTTGVPGEQNVPPGPGRDSLHV